MQTHRNKEITSTLFPSNIVKNEETISMYAVKRENVPTECHLASSPGKRPLIDSRHEMTTPYMKRTKQEDESCFWEDKESILLSSKTSLQSIVSEVAHSFENNADIYENISASQRSKKSCLNNVNRTFSTEKDTVVFQHKDGEPKRSPQIAEDVNEVATERESHKASMRSVDKGKREISVLSIADQVQAETTKPILRTIKSSDSEKSDGFAYDHNFFPKLVGVHSISLPLSSSTETDFQRKPQCSRQRQNINDYVNVGEAVDAYEVKPCASSRADQIPGDSRSQSPSNSQSEKEYDLLFTFKQDDGKNDMFLVIKDEVFSVKRFDHKGESYLVHTDNKGKTSILARAPEERKSGSQDSGSKSEATRQRVSNNRTRSTNVSTIVSEPSRQTSLQRTTSHQPVPPSISSRTLQNSYARIADINAQETAPATCGQHQLAYDDTRMLRRLLSNAEQRAEPSGSRPLLSAGQQRFLSQARADRHQVITNDLLQNSTALAISAPAQASTVLNTSSNILRNQHLIANQDLAAKNQPMHNSANEFSQQRHTNTTVPGPYSGYNTVSSGKQRYHREEIIEVDNYNKPTFAGLSSRDASETNENRIEQRRELMRYITHQLASSGNQVPSASNSSELVNLVTKGREVGGQPYSENATMGTGSSSSRYREMGGPRQHQDNGASLSPGHTEGHSTSSKSVFSGAGTNIGVCDVGQKYHPRQRVDQNSVDLHSQPHSDVPHLNVDHLQEGLQSKSETEGNSKILQIIESWKRRQQPFSSNNTFRQLRELLTRVDGSADSSQNTHSSIREGALNKHSQVRHPSTVASATPVISQISYGVIGRSTDGENVTPKRTATALVIDQRHSIYVDATDSVIDERRTPGNTGSQSSSTGNTVSGRSYQSGNVATSFPVSSDSTVRGWLQETGRPVNSNITSGQQPNFSSKLPQNPAAFSDQRFYNLEMLPRKTAPKVDKRCVANNTLSPVNSPIIPAQTIRSPHERSFVNSFVSGQRSCFNKVPVQSNPKFASANEATKPCEVPSYGLSDVAGPSEAAKLCQYVKPCEAATANGKTGTVNVVEIIDSPPAQDSVPSPPNNEKDSCKIVSGQRSCINEVPSSSTAQDTKLCHVDRNETDDVVEITSAPLKGDSIDHVTEKKDNLNSQSGEDEQTRINALRAELMRKIQNTDDRIAQENIDWKKKYLNRLKIALTKKLAKLPGVIDVTVIDDD